MSGIVIHRSRHAQQYAVIPNAIARNTRLSFRARGLLVMLLSLPPDWHVTADMLAQDNPDSRTAIRAAMRELRETGYVEVHREQGDRGRWCTRIEVFDTHSTERAQAASGPTREDMVSPQVGPNASRPAAGGAALKKKYKTSSRARAGASEEVKDELSHRAPPCPECGQPFSAELLADSDFRAMAIRGEVLCDRPECGEADARRWAATHPEDGQP